jgi:predicted N-acetyltransferase YhbS
MSNSTTTIALVEDDHAGELLTLRRAAFVTEAQLYDDPHIPPLTQTLAELREDLARDDVVTIGAWEGHRMIGSVRVEIEGEKATLGRLAVAPDKQARGIGTEMLFAVLPYLPEQTTETPSRTSRCTRSTATRSSSTRPRAT